MASSLQIGTSTRAGSAVASRSAGQQKVVARAQRCQKAVSMQTTFAKGLGMPTLPAMISKNSSFNRSAVRVEAKSTAGAPVEIEDPIYTAVTSKPVIGGLFAAFVAAVFAAGPTGTGDMDAALVQAIFEQGPFSDGVNPLFFAEFNALGLLGALYTAILAGGDDEDQILPMAPFSVLSLFVGFFSMGPYMLLRQPRVSEGEPTQDSAPFLANYFDQKPNSIFVGLWGVATFAYTAYSLTNGEARAGYADLFATNQLVNAAAIDAAILSLLIYGPIKEDMIRRGMDDSQALLYSVPLLGPSVYYLTRPALPEK